MTATAPMATLDVMVMMGTSTARSRRAVVVMSLAGRRRWRGGSGLGAGSVPRPARRPRCRRDHAESSCWSYLRGIDLAVGDDRRAQGSGGVVQAGLYGPDRDADDLGDLGQGQARVVMQDEDRAMVRREPGERAIERVAVVDRDGGVGPTRSVDRQRPDAGGPAPMPAQLRHRCSTSSRRAMVRSARGSRSRGSSRQARRNACWTASWARSASRRIR